MKLIRENKEKQRATFFCGDRYRKEWYSRPPEWISSHVKMLNEHVPNYVLASGNNWIEYKIVPGTLASEFKHTPEFIDRIYRFCLENIKQTMPYTHGDWSLSNMIIDGDNITLIDWDNIGFYHPDDVFEKLNEDLTNAFGTAFQQYRQQF
jgi:RIO-like serine/threonine protein kinase